jgi:hypothetical protein
MFGLWSRSKDPPAGVRLPDGVLTSLREARIDLGKLEPLLNPQRSEAYVFPAKGRDGPALWKTLRQTLPKSGYWPVVLGSDDTLFRHREFVPQGTQEAVDEIVRRAGETDVVALLEKLRQGVLDPDDPNDTGPGDGEWPDEIEPNRPFISCVDILTKKPLPRLWLGLFSTIDSSEIPAHVSYGGWNECPAAHEHVAMLKYWGKQYGTELVGMAEDTIHLQATRRPATREEALKLAREQFYYCSDNVYQGVDSVAALAKVLMDGDFWYFWWD